MCYCAYKSYRCHDASVNAREWTTNVLRLAEIDVLFIMCIGIPMRTSIPSGDVNVLEVAVRCLIMMCMIDV